jgi:hypothetical protein
MTNSERDLDKAVIQSQRKPRYIARYQPQVDNYNNENHAPQIVEVSKLEADIERIKARSRYQNNLSQLEQSLRDENSD